MRIWDITCDKLCRNHLLGEHRELHAIWSILVNGKKGYAHHPETLRWKGKLKALFARHDDLIREMQKRGYRHTSPLDPALATGRGSQTRFVDSPGAQIKILRGKKCDCKI
jgi:hypothetical protein